MDGFEVLKYLRGEPRFHPMGTIALLGECDGLLIRLKARLAGARQVMTKPLVRQQIVALLSEYPRRGAFPQEADQLARGLIRDDDGAHSSAVRGVRDGTAGTRMV